LLKLASFNGKGSLENVIIGLFLSDLAWPKAISLSSKLTSVDMYKKRVGKGKVGSNSCSYLLQFFVKSFVNKSSNKTPNLMVPVKYEARFKN
jgi:hypothetical protein